VLDCLGGGLIFPAISSTAATGVPRCLKLRPDDPAPMTVGEYRVILADGAVLE
jgi:hypothetical protein